IHAALQTLPNRGRLAVLAPVRHLHPGGASILNVLAGVWLIISPFVLHSTAAPLALWNTVVVGVIVVVCAASRAISPTFNVGFSWVNLVLGVWLVIAPFLMGYTGTPAALWNNLVGGAVIAILAIGSAMAGEVVRAS